MAEEPTIAALQEQLAEITAKVGEFRDNNLKLTAALEKFGDMTPEDVAEAAEIKAARERKELVDSKDIDKALDLQSAKLTEDFDRRFKAVQAELGTTKNDLRKVSVTSVLKTLAISAGVRAEAVDDVVGTYESQFEAMNGELVLHDDAKPVLSKANAGLNMLAPEFLEGLAVAKPFYFDVSGGGGGEKDHHRTKGGGTRTITREEFQSGRFEKEIRDRTVVVEGYEEDVTSSTAA